MPTSTTFFAHFSVIFTISVLCLAKAYAFDATQNAIKADIDAKQRIEGEKRDLIRQKEAQEIQNIEKSKKLKETPSFLEEKADDKTCRTINNFNISGNEEIYDFTLNNFVEKLKKEKPDSCFTKADLAKLHEQIANHYIKKGFVLARVYFDGSKISEGSISIIIEEGKLEKLKIKDNSKLNEIAPWRRSLQKFFAFPTLRDEKNIVVNLRDIEQGLDQINRLSSQSAKMALDSGNKLGYSNITIQNNISNQANLSFTRDNSGQKSTGQQKRKLAFNYDNLLGVNDNIYLNYSESNAMPFFGLSDGFNRAVGFGNNKNRFSKAFYAAASVPLGYYTFGASYSYSNYLLTTSGSATTFKSSGNSESKSFYIDRVLSRSQRYKTSLKTELNHSDTDSYLEDTYIPVNSRRTTEANFYLNHTLYLDRGSLYFQPKYSRGLKILGAMKDASNLAADKPRAQFENYGLYLQSNLNFALSDKKSLNHKFTFDSQKSNSSLYGSDQFTLGGRYTVRGFQQNIISGDSGYLLRNDLSMRLVDLVPQGFMSFASPVISKMRVSVFHDCGYVRNRVLDSATDKGYMSGAGASLSYMGKNFNCDLTYAKSLHSPEFIRTVDHQKKEDHALYFSLSFNFGFL